MPTPYPTGPIALPTSRPGSALVGPDLLETNSAVNALGAELGLSPSGPYSTVEARLVAIEAAIAAKVGLTGTVDAGWSATNVTTDRAFDALTAGQYESNRVLGTLIQKLIARGVISA